MNVYQLKIKLLNVDNPKVWRRLLVWEGITFEQLHLIIQTAMGWEFSHPWQFGYRAYDSTFCISIPDSESALDPTTEDASSVKLSDFLNGYHPKMIYTYDFGDDWQHEIILEKIIDNAVTEQLPVCIGGGGCCPPEDCGGPWEYTHLKELLAKYGPINDEDEDTEKSNAVKEYSTEEAELEWAGDWWQGTDANGDPDLEYIDIDDINKRLLRLVAGV